MMKPYRTRLIARPFLFLYFRLWCGMARRNFRLCHLSAFRPEIPNSSGVPSRQDTPFFVPHDRSGELCLQVQALFEQVAELSKIVLDLSGVLQPSARARIYIRNLPFRKIVQTFMKDCFALVFRYFVHERWERKAFIVLVGRLFP